MLFRSKWGFGAGIRFSPGGVVTSMPVIKSTVGSHSSVTKIPISKKSLQAPRFGWTMCSDFMVCDSGNFQSYKRITRENSWQVVSLHHGFRIKGVEKALQYFIHYHLRRISLEDFGIELAMFGHEYNPFEAVSKKLPPRDAE